MGKQIRKRKKSSIIAGGFLALWNLFVCGYWRDFLIRKSAYDFGYEIFNQEAMASRKRKTEEGISPWF